MSDKATAEAKHSVPFPYSYWVVPGQFLAGEHPGFSDEESTRRRLSALLDSGVRTILDLTGETEIKGDDATGPLYPVLLRSIARERQIDVARIHVPVPDRAAPAPLVMKLILDLIDRSMTEKNPVFVHCFAGIGRTGTVVGCYLKRHGLAIDYYAINKIAELRKGLPGGADMSPHTPGQVDMVNQWKEGA